MLVPAAMYTLGRSPFGPPKMAMLAVASAMVLAGLALDSAGLSELWSVVRRSKITWAVGAFAGIALLATATSIDPRQALLGSYPDYRGMLTILACVAIGAGGIVVAGREASLSRFWRALIIVSMGIIGFGVLQRAGLFPTGPQGYFKSGSRIGSTLGNSSNYGVFLAMLVPLLVQRAVAERGRVWRTLAGAGAAFGVLGLLWALSRGAWLGGIAVLVLWPIMIVWAGRSRALINRLAIGVAVAAVLAILGAAITPGFAARASKIVDIQSRTAAWRVSAWRSSWQMTLDRPFLGYGPNVYRFAYPRYQEPEQIGGARGYRVVESAHNVFFDASTSFGFPGLLAAALLVGLTGFVALGDLAKERDGLGVAPTAFVAFVGGLVSIQFHYITMDTGPMLAMLVALIAWTEAQSAPVPAVSVPAVVRPAIAIGAVVYAAAVVAGVGLMAADAAASRGAAAAKVEAVPWVAARGELRRAASLAPWEPQMRRAEGTAATVRVLKAYDPLVLTDGIDAFEDVLEVTPRDAIVAAERANLLLAAGVKAKDRALLQRAADAFGEVIEQDPNTGIPRAGRAAAYLALGRDAEAIRDFEDALERSPRDRTAWRNLAAAYERVGRTQDAERARAQARK